MNKKLIAAMTGATLALGGTAMADVFVEAGPGLGVGIADDAYDGTLGSMAAVSMTVSIDEIIKDINVTIGMSHSWVGDLTIKLVGPGLAQPITLMSRPGYAEAFDDGTGCCGDSSNLSPAIRITYDDEAPSGKSAEAMGDAIGGGENVGTGAEPDNFIPNAGAALPGDLSMFDGTSTAGVWTLYVGDGAGGDTGFIDYVSLSIRSNPIPAPGALALLGLAGLARRRRRA